jgi:hypothetical protein
MSFKLAIKYKINSAIKMELFVEKSQITNVEK